jgi:acetoin utilization deacetylase AcuC-like enzyme
MGGLHHARKSKASGFCYLNDCVLAIMRLLCEYRRVLYIDIDVHHGDGVEEAFLTTNRVMTLSFHQYEADQSFFPGTGSVDDFGDEDGLYHSINVPILSGCTNINYEIVFKNVVDKVFDRYRPEAVVLQCGSDSVVGDRIGGFNLTIEGHGNAFKHVLSKGVPTVCLGGGGYMAENVSRCWAYESFLALGKEAPTMLPQNLEYHNIYTVTDLLVPLPNIQESKAEMNTKEYINKLLGRVDELIKNVEIAPGTPFMPRPNLEENRQERREVLELMEEGPAIREQE